MIIIISIVLSIIAWMIRKPVDNTGLVVSLVAFHAPIRLIMIMIMSIVLIIIAMNDEDESRQGCLSL